VRSLGGTDGEAEPVQTANASLNNCRRNSTQNLFRAQVSIVPGFVSEKDLEKGEEIQL
jgi:hypothetical protein